MKIDAQPGFVVIEFTPEEEKEDGNVALESGLIVPAHVAESKKEVETHKEWKVLGVSEMSQLKVGVTVITSPAPVIIEVKVQGETIGIMPEHEVMASYIPEKK